MVIGAGPPVQVDPGALPLVSCAPLAFVLQRLALRRINFWSLDVEGAEFEVLRTVDFSQVSSRQNRVGSASIS